MGKELFNRSATLTVGTTAMSGKKFAGLRIAFEIDKTSEGLPNPAKVTIYNLAASSRADLEAKNLIMILEAGYRGIGFGNFVQQESVNPILSRLFIGDVKRVKSSRQGPDIVTVLEGGDAETAIKETKIDQSFAPLTSISQIIQTLASKLGVVVGTIAPGLTDVFQNGLSISGLVSDNLDVLTKKHGLEWSVTDGQLNVLMPAQATNEPAVALSKATGLIGIPSKREDGAGIRIEFSSLLNTGIRPGRSISLKSEAITGVFKVRRCRYQGDTHGGDWLVAGEAV